MALLVPGRGRCYFAGVDAGLRQSRCGISLDRKPGAFGVLIYWTLCVYLRVSGFAVVWYFDKS